eukprot:jgi/Ulvmu1/8870/UM049_0052.1
MFAKFRAPVSRAMSAPRMARMDAKNGIFYSTSTGHTADIAELIKEKLGDSVEGPFEADEGKFAEYDNLIVGAPTWNTGADSDRSGTAWDAVDSGELGDLKGKTVACFGLGDSTAYSDYFCDAMGELHDKFQAAGAKMVGYVENAEYEYEDSKAVVDDMFVGLALDEDNEDDKSAPRIDAWITQLKSEMDF